MLEARYTTSEEKLFHSLWETCEEIGMPCEKKRKKNKLFAFFFTKKL
jgi:hypothetical protein